MKDTKWLPANHSIPGTGRISTYYSTRESDWPVRDVSDSRGLDHVMEPNLETATYNLHATCNQRVVRNAINAGDYYLFFVTEDSTPNHAGRLIVSGYYTIDEVARLPGRRYAIRTKHPHFVGPPDTVSTNKVWRAVFGKAAPTNKLYTKRKLDAEKTRRLLGFLKSGRNQTSRYVQEIRRLANR